jgi:hypothetical protein
MRLKGESIMRQWPDAIIPDDLQKKIDQKPTEDLEFIEATILDQKLVISVTTLFIKNLKQS